MNHHGACRIVNFGVLVLILRHTTEDVSWSIFNEGAISEASSLYANQIAMLCMK
jgi:hypothetical protein